MSTETKTESPDPSGATEFCQLDPRWIGLSRVSDSIAWGVIGAILIAFGSGLLLAIPWPWKAIIFVVWMLIAGLAALNIVWWPHWDHARWSYRVGETVVELRFGVVWHVVVAIPLSRLQHVDLHRGPLERRWGLASIQIHTAGTRDASHTVPGLDFAIATSLRDQLIAAANRGSGASEERVEKDEGDLSDERDEKDLRDEEDEEELEGDD